MNYFAFNQLLFASILFRIVCSENHLNEFYPFLVKIEAKGKILVCAGTILTSCTVLTSAHCVEGVEPSGMTVTHITSTITTYNVNSTVIHPQYNRTILANDVALLQMEKKFEEPWAAVTLNNLPKEEVFSECNFIEIIGWSGQIMKDSYKNDTSADPNAAFEKPMKAVVKLISNENCTTLIKNFGGIFQGEEKLCGVNNEEGEEEGCFTGPGGPLMCYLFSPNSKEARSSWSSRKSSLQHIHSSNKNGTLADPIDLLENWRKLEDKKYKREIDKGVRNLQVGVVSWGKSCSKVPSVYIKTDFYYNWITETAKKMTVNKCSGNFNGVLGTPTGSGGAPLTCFASFNIVNFSAYYSFVTIFMTFYLLLFTSSLT